MSSLTNGQSPNDQDISYIALRRAQWYGDPRAEDYREDLEQDPRVTSLIEELRSWPGPSISSHKSAQQYFHKLVFLADIGVTVRTPGVKDIVERILVSFDADHVPCIGMQIGANHSGSGQPLPAWALCDAPSILYALHVMGCEDRAIAQGVESLASLLGDEGYGCHVSRVLGSWRGPGKKSDPCPYATLIMLKLLISIDPEQYAGEISVCAYSLLGLWEQSLTRHPYIFYMGYDFRRLKVPFIWYDILHVVDVLSQVPSIHRDSRFQEMVGIIKEKASADGYIPESIYLPWKEWDFGQKKQPSPWMTFCIERIEDRIGGV